MHGANDIHSMESSKAGLVEIATAHFSTSGNKWFAEALQAVANSGQVDDDLGLYSAMARRKLGVETLPQVTTIDTRFAAFDIHRWNSAEIGRLILLMAAIESQPGEAQGIIRGYYQAGDESERMALLR
jgi:hypothetical protein